jgi:NodT family efflux transporter outer membrane factor (OMF) lipoprotein
MLGALEDNRAVKIASLDVAIAESDVGIANSAHLPTLNSNLEFNRTSPSQSSFQGRVLSGAFNQHTLSLLFDWEIDLFGALRARRRASKEQFYVSKSERYGTELSVTSSVALRYFEIRTFQARKRLLRDQIDMQTATSEMVRSRREAGLAAELDVVEAEAELAKVQATLEDAELGLLESVRQLALLLGQQLREFNFILEKDGTLLPEPTLSNYFSKNLSSTLLKRRPDIRAANHALKAATFERFGTELDFFPRFSLSAALGYQSFQRQDLLQPPSQYWNIIPGLTLPIFSGLRLSNQLTRAEGQEQKAFLRYEDTILQALAEVESTVRRLKRLEKRYTLFKRAMESQQTAFALAQDQYTHGLIDFFRVLESQRRLLTARESMVITQGEVFRELVVFYKALGGSGAIKKRASQDKA